MNTPLSWIKAYVPELDCSSQEYTDAMTLSGTKVEGYKELDADLDKIVVGQIERIEKHPDADKLVVCQVNVGTETVQIVTGASNVEEGQKIPVVLDGGRVAGGHDGSRTPGGIKIKKGKLRGVPSAGMMCSIEELGSDREMYPDAPEDGIYILKEDSVVGSDAVELLGLHDTVFEYEITSNRVDCFSVLGIAREAAATFRKPFLPPIVEVKANGEDVNDYISVQVEDKDLCKRYCARVVKNVKIEPSPEWMQRRLAASGIRPINNLVDITNYVMEEYSKITDDVKDMVFEAACFDGTNIRLSAKRLGLRTDASGKFEKGLDPNNALEAINRACQLIEMLGAGEVVGGVVDIYDEVRQPKRISFEPEKMNRLLGTGIGSGQMLDYFKTIGLEYDESSNEVVVPTFRQDLECMADLAEEVARFYGYDNIPSSLPQGEATAGKLSYKLRIEGIAKDIAEFCGFSQGMTYSFESPKVFDKLLLPEDSSLRQTVDILNPLGEDFSIMRTTTLNGMLTSLSTNYNRRNKNVRLYELGNVYLPKAVPVTELPDERMQFTLGMYGDGDFYTMKGVVEEFLEKVGMKKIVRYDKDAGKPFLHPGRQANILYAGEVIGYLGEVHPQVLDNYNIGDRAYIAILDMPTIYDKTTFDRKYEGIAKYPAVSRDISMIMPKSLQVGDVEEVIRKKGGSLLESYQLFDIYEGAQIQMGYKSVAYSIVFRAKDHTLEEKEVSEIMDKILGALETMDIELRA